MVAKSGAKLPTGFERSFGRSDSMAVETVMKRAVKRIVKTLDKFAANEGWKTDEYRVLFHLNPDVGRIHVVVIARSFPGKDIEDKWLNVLNFLERDLDDPELLSAILLTLRTFK